MDPQTTPAKIVDGERPGSLTPSTAGRSNGLRLRRSDLFRSPRSANGAASKDPRDRSFRSLRGEFSVGGFHVAKCWPTHHAVSISSLWQANRQFCGSCISELCAHSSVAAPEYEYLCQPTHRLGNLLRHRDTAFQRAPCSGISRDPVTGLLKAPAEPASEDARSVCTRLAAITGELRRVRVRLTVAQSQASAHAAGRCGRCGPIRESRALLR